MRFDTTQRFERLMLALGVAAVGITLLATVARSHGEPILEVHREAAVFGQQVQTHFKSPFRPHEQKPPRHPVSSPPAYRDNHYVAENWG